MKNVIYFTNYRNSGLTSKWINNVVNKILLRYHINDIVEIGIMLISKEKIKKLNNLYRSIDSATDVLSFGQTMTKKLFKNTPRMLGDIVICYPIAKTQAVVHAHSVKSEIEFLITHGFKHLIGIHHKNNI